MHRRLIRCRSDAFLYKTKKWPENTFWNSVIHFPLSERRRFQQCVLLFKKGFAWRPPDLRCKPWACAVSSRNDNRSWLVSRDAYPRTGKTSGQSSITCRSNNKATRRADDPTNSSAIYLARVNRLQRKSFASLSNDMRDWYTCHNSLPAPTTIRQCFAVTRYILLATTTGLFWNW